MIKNLCLYRDGTVVDDGSQSTGASYVERDGRGFWGYVVVHQRRLFLEVTPEEWEAISAHLTLHGVTLVAVADERSPTS